MEVKDLIAQYQEYAMKNRLIPTKHRTYFAYMLADMSELISWVDQSTDGPTDCYTNAMSEMSHFYRLMEKSVDNYEDGSLPFLVDDKIPSLFINRLADLMIQVLMYVGATDLEEEFLDSLEDRVQKDKVSTVSERSRFMNKRLDW